MIRKVYQVPLYEPNLPPPAPDSTSLDYPNIFILNVRWSKINDVLEKANNGGNHGNRVNLIPYAGDWLTDRGGNTVGTISQILME